MDSQPALAMMYNQMYLARPQQILARYHFAGTECSSKKSCTWLTLVQAYGSRHADHASVAVVRYNKKLIGMMQVLFVMEVVKFHHVMHFFEFLSAFITCFNLVIFGYIVCHI